MQTRTFFYLQIFFFCFLLLFSINGYGQKNLFAVPSNDSISRGENFFQPQLLITDDEINPGLVITHGLGHDFEIGVNIQQVLLQTDKSPVFTTDDKEVGENPLVLINIRKGFWIRPWYSIALGSQTGPAFGPEHSQSGIATFNYLNNRWSIPETQNKLILGMYYSNELYSGTGNNLGVMAGLEGVLIKERMTFQADFMSGNNLMSVINIGLGLNITKDWEFGAAAQLPVPGSSNPRGILFQLSYN